MNLARGASERLIELTAPKGILQRAIRSSETTGHAQPAHTVFGRIEQALKWLDNPAIDDKGLGELLEGAYFLSLSASPVSAQAKFICYKRNLVLCEVVRDKESFPVRADPVTGIRGTNIVRKDFVPSEKISAQYQMDTVRVEDTFT